jgi:hypothetical protein
VALLAEYVIEAYRARSELRVFDAEFGAALADEAAHRSGLADAAEVSLHIGHEARDSGLAEGLGEDLEGYGLAGSGGSGDKAVAVSHPAANGYGTLRPVGHIQSVS